MAVVCVPVCACMEVEPYSPKRRSLCWVFGKVMSHHHPRWPGVNHTVIMGVIAVPCAIRMSLAKATVLTTQAKWHRVMRAVRRKR